jgi:beta-xylosidase
MARIRTLPATRWWLSAIFALLLLTLQVQAIKNPIIPGWDPDPTILRVGDEYFIVASSLEYFPVSQYNSRRTLRTGSRSRML